MCSLNDKPKFGAILHHILVERVRPLDFKNILLTLGSDTSALDREGEQMSLSEPYSISRSGISYQQRPSLPTAVAIVKDF